MYETKLNDGENEKLHKVAMETGAKIAADIINTMNPEHRNTVLKTIKDSLQANLDEAAAAFSDQMEYLARVKGQLANL